MTAVKSNEGPSHGTARAVALFGVKSVHSIAFFIIQSAILYLLYTGARGRSDRKAALAAGIALGESAIYAGNGFRCPLTGVAERLGAENGAITDIFLPKWLARNVANIYVPLLLTAIALHARNLLSRGHAAPDERNVVAIEPILGIESPDEIH